MSKAVVTRMKTDLEAQGVDLRGPCGAFAITGRVAWELRETGLGLVAKREGQNGCTVPGHGHFAVDAVMFRDGTTYDVLANAETENIPAWNLTGSQPPGAWRAPFRLDDTPVPPPADPPVAGGDDEHRARLRLLETRAALLWEVYAELAKQIGTINQQLAALDLDVVRKPLPDYIAQRWGFTIVSKPR